MLTQLQSLPTKIDGRYATDHELKFTQDYLQVVRLRFATYQKLQTLEQEIVNEVYKRMMAKHPNLLKRSQGDLSVKWKKDTLRVLRYSATAMLLNDETWLKEKLLLWFETIMRAFGAEESCYVTYELMQAVVEERLSTEEFNLFQPILKLNQTILGNLQPQAA